MQKFSLLEGLSQPLILDKHLSSNFDRFSPLTYSKSYAPISGCVIEHVITTTNLTNLEKIYYLLADSLATINQRQGCSRSYALPSDDWAVRLSCSRSLVFTMQRSLVKKGYFIISKDFDTIGRNKRNLITPTIPSNVFNNLNERFPDRVRDHDPYNPLIECKRTYLDRTKLFIKLNYNLLKIIAASKNLNPQQKILWLGFYTNCYKNYMLQGRENFNRDQYPYNGNSGFSFTTSYKELADKHSCSTKSISKAAKNLEKLGFIKAHNIYIRKKCSDDDDNICGDHYEGDTDNRRQERQDKSLWRITLSLPDNYSLELAKVNNRSSFTSTSIGVKLENRGLNTATSENCLMLNGVKINLSLEQSTLLQSLIGQEPSDLGLGNNIPDPGDNCSNLVTTSTDDYINSVMEELETGDEAIENDKLAGACVIEGGNVQPDPYGSAPGSFSSASPKGKVASKEEKSDGNKSNPHVAKSGLLLNKDLKSKIKDIKSNLGPAPKVLLDIFFKRFRKDKSNTNIASKDNKLAKEFNIQSELIREKLKTLPKDKADKARKFAYSIYSNLLAKGYAATLTKHELAKQIIHHAATWKPTRLGSVSREKEIDTALSVAWKKIVEGTWQIPLELAKAEILQNEYSHHKEKYLHSGILSHEISTLEVEVDKLLGGYTNISEKITSSSSKQNKEEVRVEEVRLAVEKIEQGIEDVSLQASEYGSQSLEVESSFMSPKINYPEKKNLTPVRTIDLKDTYLAENSAVRFHMHNNINDCGNKELSILSGRMELCRLEAGNTLYSEGYKANTIREPLPQYEETQKPHSHSLGKTLVILNDGDVYIKDQSRAANCFARVGDALNNYLSKLTKPN